MNFKHFLLFIIIFNISSMVAMEFEKTEQAKEESEEQSYLEKLPIPLREALMPYLVSGGTLEKSIDNITSFLTFAEHNKLLSPLVDDPKTIETIINMFSKEWKLDKAIVAALLSDIPGAKQWLDAYKQHHPETSKLPGASKLIEDYFFQLIERNKPALIQLIAHSGIDLNVLNGEGLTPLMVAVKRGYVPIVKVLAQQGANVNAPTAYGYTPLHFAAREGYKEGYLDILETLLRAGARVNEKDKFNDTALDMAVGRISHYYLPQYIRVIKRLLEAGATGKPDTINDVETLRKQDIWQQG